MGLKIKKVASEDTYISLVYEFSACHDAINHGKCDIVTTGCFR